MWLQRLNVVGESGCRGVEHSNVGAKRIPPFVPEPEQDGFDFEMLRRVAFFQKKADAIDPAFFFRKRQAVGSLCGNRERATDGAMEHFSGHLDNLPLAIASCMGSPAPPAYQPAEGWQREWATESNLRRFGNLRRCVPQIMPYDLLSAPRSQGAGIKQSSWKTGPVRFSKRAGYFPALSHKQDSMPNSWPSSRSHG